MSALFGSNGPGTADVVRLRGDFIVLAFAKCVPDGMNRRKVQDVETHRGDVRKPSLAIPQRSLAAGLGSAGSGKHLVPSRKAGLLAVDNQAKLLPVPRSDAAIGVSLDGIFDFVSKNCLFGA